MSPIAREPIPRLPYRKAEDKVFRGLRWKLPKSAQKIGNRVERLPIMVVSRQVASEILRNLAQG